MRSWIWTLFLLAAAVALALVVQDHAGNVIIIAQPWRIELSLSLALVLVILLFFLLYLLLNIFSWLGQGPRRLRSWHGRRTHKKEIGLLESGWINILEGHYAQAEKDLASLLSRTRSVERKVLAGLSSARALHLLGEYVRRDHILHDARLAAGNNTRLRQAADIVTADMLLDQRRAEEALDLLEPLQDASSRLMHGTRLLLRAHRQLGHADQVYALTRLLLRRSAIDEGQADRFIRESAARLLAGIDETGWSRLWGELTASERTDPQVALAGAQAQIRMGNQHDAGRILEASLGRKLDDRLLRLYSQCDESQARQRLGHAELWLKNNPDHPGLLAAMGQLCLTAQLWGQGEHYLERSLALRSDIHIHALLGNLHNALGKPELALQHWRKACEAADDFIMPAIHKVLPAADTRADPRFDIRTEPAGPESADQVPEAASAAYTQEDYYDTAPLPGVDMSQTSDRGARQGPHADV